MTQVTGSRRPKRTSDKRLPMPSVGELARSITRQLPLLDAKRAGAELYGAPRLNSFSLFNPNENTISRLAGDLLDPRGSHGQGTLFLNALLTRLKLPRVGAADPVRVRREAVTNANRRIDLVVETPALLLGIENKPWAGQQPQQLRDYVDALNQWAGKKQAVLVFLSDQEPRTAKGEVVALPFIDGEDGVSLKAILEDVVENIRASRARTHVEEFIVYIDEQFGGVGMVDRSDEPYVDAVEAEFDLPQHRKAVAAVLLSQDRLHARIIDSVGDHLLAALGNEAFEIESEYSLSEALKQKEEPWLVRRSNWPVNLALSIEAAKLGFAGIYFGVRAPDPSSPEVKEWRGSACAARKIVEPTLRNVSGGHKSSWWPWWSYAVTRNWGSEFAAKIILHSSTNDIGDHPEIAEMTERFVALAASIDSALETG